MYGGLLGIGLVGIVTFIFGLRNVEEQTTSSPDSTQSSIDSSSKRPAPRFVNNLNWIDVDLGLDLEYGKDTPPKTNPLTKTVTFENICSPARGSSSKCCRSCWNAFVDVGRLFKTKDMALLAVTCFYTGVEIGFCQGVYSGCIGFTEAFGKDRAKYVGLSGILIGVGEVSG